MGQKYIIFPVPLYDGGGWLSSDIMDSKYNKVNRALGYAGNTLNVLGKMMNEYGQFKYNNQSIFQDLGAEEQFKQEPKYDSSGNPTGEYTQVPTGVYKYKGPMSANKKFGLRTEGFYIRDDGDDNYTISKDYNLLNGPKQFKNGGWTDAAAATGAVGDTLNIYSDTSQIDNAAVQTAKTLLKNDISTPVTANSFDSLMQEAANIRKNKTDWTRRDFQGGSSFKNVLKGGLSAAGSGLKTAFMTGNIWAGIGAAAAGTLATVFGNKSRKAEARRQRDIANNYGLMANAYQDYKIADRAEQLRDAQSENYERGWYGAEGGQFFTGNFQGLMPEEDKVSKFQEMVKDDNRVGIDSINLGELSENQEIDGLSQSDIRKLRKAGYKFDIIG